MLIVSILRQDTRMRGVQVPDVTCIMAFSIVSGTFPSNAQGSTVSLHLGLDTPYICVCVIANNVHGYKPIKCRSCQGSRQGTANASPALPANTDQEREMHRSQIRYNAAPAPGSYRGLPIPKLLPAISPPRSHRYLPSMHHLDFFSAVSSLFNPPSPSFSPK